MTWLLSFILLVEQMQLQGHEPQYCLFYLRGALRSTEVFSKTTSRLAACTLGIKQYSEISVHSANSQKNFIGRESGDEVKMKTKQNLSSHFGKYSHIKK